MNGQAKKYFLTIAFIFVLILVPSRFIFAATIVENTPKEVRTGDIVSVEWLLNTDGDMLNVIDGIIKYPSDMVDVVSIEPSDVGPIIWVNGPSNADGSISFTGGIPVGVRGVMPIFRMDMRIKQDGLINFNIAPNSIAYLADGSANTVPLLMDTLTIRSSKDFKAITTKVSSIDTEPPTISSAVIGHDPSLFNDQQFLSVIALDKQSGVAFTKAKVGLFGAYHIISNPYLLHRPLVGDSISIKVSDKAGNESYQAVPYIGHLSTKEFLYGTIILVLFALIGVFVYKKIICKKNI